jgi:alkaline phosphatase D
VSAHRQRGRQWSRRAWCAAAASALACRRGEPESPAPRTAADRENTTRIVFGSCCDQRRPAPIWDAIVARDADLFLFIGDNVYADAEDEAKLRAAYDMLGASEGWQKLVARTPVLAVWDDHDYGRNDAGSEYPLRDISQKIMLDFFAEPADSPRRSQQGVYFAKTFGSGDKAVQVILLDTRYFRDPLVPQSPGAMRYQPNPDPAATMLGEVQWKWLAARLAEPAAVRLLVSSIQVIADEHPFESWGLFPHERARLYELIGKTDGVLVLSGDRHRAELSRTDAEGLAYPLHDLTSSSLNLPLVGGDPNRYRVGPLVEAANFGAVTIDWAASALELELALVDGSSAMRHSIDLASLMRA